MKILILFYFCFISMVMARSPRRYLEKTIPPPMHILTQFQTNSVIASGAGGSSTSDVSNIWTGVQSNRLTAGNAAAVLFTQTLAQPVNICFDSAIRVTFYPKNKTQVLNMQSLVIYLFTDGSNFTTFEVGSYGIRDTNLTYWGGWDHYFASLKKFTPTGTFECSSVNAIGLEFRALAAVQDTISFGEISTFRRRMPKATILFTVDDNYEAWRTNGAPKLDSLCMDYTMFINGGRVGTPLYSNEGQLDSMFFRSRCSKPDIAPHLWMHDSITKYTVDSALASIRRGQAQIRGKGWCRPGQCAVTAFAYPYGNKSHLMDSVLRASGLIDFARMARDYNQGETQQINDIFACRQLATIGSGYDTTTLKAYVDTLIAHRGLGIFTIHKIDTVGCTEDGITWCKDHWLSAINYIHTKVAAGVLQVVNWSNWMQEYGGGLNNTQRSGLGRR